MQNVYGIVFENDPNCPARRRHIFLSSQSNIQNLKTLIKYISNSLKSNFQNYSFILAAKNAQSFVIYDNGMG